MKTLLGAARWAVLTPMVALSIAPMFWMAVAALKPGDAPLAASNPWWPSPPTLENFAELFGDPQFGHWVANTALVAGAPS